jgi:hypothetical protein
VRGALNLDKTPGMSDKKEADITDKWLDVADEVGRELEGKGFHIPPKPDFSPDPVTAKALIGSSPEEYAEIYTSYLRWYNYATPLKAQVEAELLGYNAAIEELAVTTRQEVKALRPDKGAGKAAEKEIKEAVEENPSIRELKFRRLKWQEMLIRIDAQLKIISKNMAVISRVQEERQTEFTGERRDSNVRHTGAVHHRRFKR